MKNLILGTTLALALATPAMAQNENFTGARIGVTAGASDVTGVRSTSDITYGADVGVDFPVGDRVTLGVEAFSDNPFENDRILGAAGRVGYAVTDSALVFGRAGYSNYKDAFSRELDGLTVGGGVEFAVSDMTYARVEYRYSDFEQNIGSHGALVGLGLRF